ncbi:MAG: CPBP family intramembrane metalloprotease [Candidatus Hodarchaeaceae archaeon]|nr:CPBP family intramembrane metalloprotease [Candidatus Hodarchaeaceae archaeon]
MGATKVKQKFRGVKKSKYGKIELAAALGLYAIITVLAFETSMKIEWVWRIPQLFFPIAAVLLQHRSLESLGLTRKNFFRCMELGALAGILLTMGLAPLYLTWLQPKMPERLGSLIIFYAVIFIFVNVVAIEVFYRGYIQPQLEATIGLAPGLIVTSLLCGLDFLEYKVFDPAMIVIAALVFGFLYQKKRSLVAPLTAHTSYFLLTMVALAF